MPSTSTLITATTVTFLVGLAGYAIYFDYVRRNDPGFRRQLRKEKKRADKSAASMKAAAASAASIPTAQLREAVDTIRAEKLPETADGREKYFASNLATAEQLGMQNKIMPAATCLYRAMRVYPQPVELMVALEQSFPVPVFKAVMDMMKLEVSPNSPPLATPKSSAASDSASATSSRKSTRRSRKESDTTRTSSGKSSPGGTGPPSETSSSYEWDKVTEPDSSATPPSALQGDSVA